MKKLLIIDSNSLAYRAFHALPFFSNREEPLNAVYGFLLIFFKAIKDFESDYIAATFDFPAPTFRHKKFKEYKAKRPPCPEDLISQIPKIKEVLTAFSVPIFEKKGFEADDLIGAIAQKSSLENIVLSGDSDLFQLVNEKTKVSFLRKGVKEISLYDKNLVKERFGGLNPCQILDFKSLKGDASDNIPGVFGIGEKTAISLILKFKNLENIYKEIEKQNFDDKAFKKGARELLLKYKKQAFLSKELAEIKIETEINFNLKDCFWRDYDKSKAQESLKKFGFYSLLKKMPGFNEIEISDKINKSAKIKEPSLEKENNSFQEKLF